MRTENRGRRAVRVVLATLAFLAAAPVAAFAAAADPAVARVAFIEGEASYLNGDADEWTTVDTNAPLVAGDRFYSGSGGRAELQLASGIYARLASDTELDLLDLDRDVVHVRVGIGTAIFRLREPPTNRRVEISTPGAAVIARARGVYRIDVASDGRTTIVVREGEADAYRGDDRYRLGDGRGAEFQEVGYEYGDAPIDVFDASVVARDDWEDWEATRAARVDAAVGYQYVSDEVYGVEDLDEYGTWDRHETYGPVWRPRSVPVGWAPYTTGRWVWQDPWGWSWVDYQPWGWAPSHYGRWVYVSSAWAWAPGPIVAAPVYAPATVGFFGVSVNTPGVSVSVGFGGGLSVGWVPLGWGEPIVPWWGGWGGPRIVNSTVINKNITNINVQNINYRNFDQPGAFTAVSRRGFVTGELDRVSVPRERLRDVVRPIKGSLGVVPERQSLAAVRPERLRRGRAVTPAQESLERASVTSRTPRAQGPRFEERRQLIESKKGAPLTPEELTRVASRDDSGRRTRLVTARGGRRVKPEVTAEAPARLGESVRRTAGGGADELRDATGASRLESNARGDVARDGGRATRNGGTVESARGAGDRTRERVDSRSGAAADRERAAVQRERDGGRARDGAGDARGAKRRSREEAARQRTTEDRKRAATTQSDRESSERRQRAVAVRQQETERRKRDAVVQQERESSARREREQAMRRQQESERRSRAASAQRDRQSAEEQEQAKRKDSRRARSTRDAR